jgi:hypothetical protein
MTSITPFLWFDNNVPEGQSNPHGKVRSATFDLKFGPELE